MPSSSRQTRQRKSDHLRIALAAGAQRGDGGFDAWKFTHNALPEIDFADIDTSVTFLGRTLRYPFFISSMTGGIAEGKTINKHLLAAADKHGIAIGMGSQRAAIEDVSLRSYFPKPGSVSVPLFANLGIVQANYGFDVSKFEEAVTMIGADALMLHCNPLQEAIQKEGQTNFSGLMKKIELLVKKLSVPVIVKEVGFGISDDVCRRLYKAGVRYVDTAGWGGTNWAHVEGERHDETRDLGELFSQWGIPTTESLMMCKEVADEVQGLTILASGGIRNGLDVAKAIAMGATLVGIGAPFAKAARQSQKAVEDLIEKLGRELKTAMFGVGVKTLKQLSGTTLKQVGKDF